MQSLVVNLSYTKKIDGTFRLDAEHYRDKYLRIHNKLIDFGSQSLADLILRPVMTGHTPSMANPAYYGGDVNFIKTDNLREFNITADFSDSLTKSGNNLIKRSSLREKDVIVTIIGATYKIVGRTCLINKKDLPANINQNIALIRCSNKIQPEFLTVYLNTYYGKNYLWFLSRQTEQVNLNCREVEKVLVPNCGVEFQNIISQIYMKSNILLNNSIEYFSQAEELLLNELALSDWQAKHELSFVKNFSDTQVAERIDAEYFQPKYEQIIQAVKSYKHGWSKLGNMIKITKSVEPGSSEYLEDGIKFLRVSNLTKFGTDNGSPVYLSKNYYKQFKHLQPKQGEILLTKDATLGIAYYLNETPEKMLLSGGILRLKLKDDAVNEQFLTLVLNSIVVQSQAERDAGGSIIKHWRIDQIKNVDIPILNKKSQTKIKDLIEKSFSARTESKRLLEVAKVGVEMAIEKDEKTAIKWIDKQVEE